MKSHIIDKSDSFLHTAENTSLYFDGVSGYIYAAYIGNGLIPYIAQCRVDDLDIGDWIIIQVDSFPVLNDSHNGISLGVDTAGNVHVSWNMHNIPGLIYKRTTIPHDLTTLEWVGLDFEIGNSPQENYPQLSYPRFVRSGDSFYLTFRNGVPGNAHQILLTWNNEDSRWVNDPGMIIDGSNNGSGSFSPYLGCVRSLSSLGGSILSPFVNRVGLYNTTLDLLIYDPSFGVGVEPIQSSQSNKSFANTGLSTVIISEEIFVSYLMVSESGYPEIYISRMNIQIGEWSTYQITDLQLERLRACPQGPQDGPYRPCDVELQGLWMGITGENDEVIRLIYGRSVSLPGSAWQRPVTILYECLSYDLGLTWDIKELSLPIPQLTTELSINNNSQRFDFALCQDIEGNVRLLDFRDRVVKKNEVDVSFDSDHTLCLKTPLSNPPFYSLDKFEVELKIKPYKSSQPMGLIDCGGVIGSRYFRVLLWGKDRPLVYSPNNLQILIGDGENWITFWYPEIVVEPNVYTHLKIVKTNDGLGKPALIIYRLLDKQWIVETLISLNMFNRKMMSGGEVTPYNSTLLIGGAESGTKTIVYPFSGRLDVKIHL